MPSQSNDIEHVWDLAEKIGTCMLTTATGPALRSRPMHAMPDREASCLWFITDDRGAKEDEIRAAPVVSLAFADTRANIYLNLTGRAEIYRDAAKAEKLWNNEAQAWWPKGPSDPDVRVLCVRPDSAEFWDSRGNSTLIGLKLAAARMSGNPPDLGENKKVQMR
jgi:general stress protein 26